MAKERKMQSLYVFKFCIYCIDDTQSTIQKKMAPVHFTTIPCKTTNMHREGHIFWDILTRTRKFVCARFEVLRTFSAFQ